MRKRFGSAGVSDYKGWSGRTFELRNQNGVATQKVFDSGRAVVAVFKVDDFRRRIARTGELYEVGISRDNGQAVFLSIFPDRLVWGVSREPRVEHVNRTGKELSQPADELR